MNEAETRAEHIDPALKAAGVVDGSRPRCHPERSGDERSEVATQSKDPYRQFAAGSRATAGMLRLRGSDAPLASAALSMTGK